MCSLTVPSIDSRVIGVPNGDNVANNSTRNSVFVIVAGRILPVFWNSNAEVNTVRKYIGIAIIRTIIKK